jgi:hypothetical protein
MYYNIINGPKTLANSQAGWMSSSIMFEIKKNKKKHFDRWFWLDVI